MTSLPVDPEVPDEVTDEQIPDEEAAEEKPRLDLTVTVTKPSACERHVTVEVPREDVDRYFQEAVSEMAPTAAVPGFRPGRAPRKLVESRFRQDLQDKIKGSILYDSLTQVTEDQGFASISEPDFDIDSVILPDEGPMTFEFDLEVRPEFETPNWKGLALERPVREVTAAEVDYEVTRILKQWAELVPSTEPVAAGDVIRCDIVFRHDGSTVSSAEDQQLEVLQNLSFHDGMLFDFQKLVVGAQPNEERAGQIEISESCPTEALRGETVQATIRIREVLKWKTPEFTPELLAKIGKFESEGDLRDYLRELLQRQHRYRQNQKVREQISNLLVEAADWELPPNLLKRQAGRELERAIMELHSSGFSDAEIQAHANVLRQTSQESTARALKEHFVLERIAEDEEIDASEEDFDAEILQMALQSNESPRSIRARIDKRGSIDVLRNQIVERKVIELIQSEAKFKDIPYEPPRQTTTAVDLAIGERSHDEIPTAKHGDEPRELNQSLDRT